MRLSDFTFPYDRTKMIEKTKAAPEWVHFGAGNIFRAFPCALAEKLLADGKLETGVIAIEGFDTEIIERAYLPYDNVSLLVTLCGDGSVKKQPIGSVAEALTVADAERITEIFSAPSLKVVSFTITEKGYAVKNPAGELFGFVKADLDGKLADAKTTIGVLTRGLYTRYLGGKLPVSLLSMDNCSGNGDKLRAAVLTYAEAWCRSGECEDGFLSYLNDGTKIAFPCSMIDKITPRPDANVARMLEDEGFTDTELIITEKKTYTSPFVNAEAPQYLVAEDKFPAGKLPLDEVGVIFTDRETVDKTEKMKVCTCLNPLHTALAVYGCLLGHVLISEEMKDPELVKLVNRLGYVEGLPVVVDPGIISPKAFIDEVVGERLPNPFMPDAPQRIATDTSQKLPIRLGETIKAYIERGMDMESLVAVPLVAAGWCRYLLAIDDFGEKFTPSPDPRFEECAANLAAIGIGCKDKGEIHESLYPILSDAGIFGVDLYKTPIGVKAEEYFESMIGGVGAVRDTLKAVL